MGAVAYTVHGVLAGAYRGADIAGRALLQHASVDGGETALCKRTRNLCDAVESGDVDCSECLARIARRKLARADYPIATPGVPQPTLDICGRLP